MIRRRFRLLLAQGMPRRPEVHQHNHHRSPSCKISVLWLTRRMPLLRSKPEICDIQQLLNGLRISCATTRQSLANSAPKSPTTAPPPSQPPNSSTPSSPCLMPRALNWESWSRSWRIFTRTSRNVLRCCKPGTTGAPSMKITQLSQDPAGFFQACHRPP